MGGTIPKFLLRNSTYNMNKIQLTQDTILWCRRYWNYRTQESLCIYWPARGL